jgi:hypothetical protein
MSEAVVLSLHLRVVRRHRAESLVTLETRGGASKGIRRLREAAADSGSEEFLLRPEEAKNAACEMPARREISNIDARS